MPVMTADRTKCSPTIVWLPRHLGIEGNEAADGLCQRALHHDTVDIPKTLEYRDARTIYRDLFLRKWLYITTELYIKPKETFAKICGTTSRIVALYKIP